MQALFAAAESDGFGLASLWPALIWLGVLILALVVEGLTTDLGAICFVPGALVAMILAVFEVHGAIQIAVCIAISVTLMILVKTVFKKFLRKSGDAVDTSVDSLTGRLAMVKEEINNI